MPAPDGLNDPHLLPARRYFAGSRVSGEITEFDRLIDELIRLEEASGSGEPDTGDAAGGVAGGGGALTAAMGKRRAAISGDGVEEQEDAMMGATTLRAPEQERSPE